jgi:triacylglycerol esterase/lipase EstA (alpha/beta hydrolase family)
METRSAIARTARGVARALRRGDATSVPALGERPPILLLPGFGASRQVLLPLARDLERRLSRPVVRVSLGQSLPIQLGDVRASARRVHAELEALASGARFPFVDVVGHSLGGLVATYLLKRLDRGARVRRVVTLGTPHRGTPLALAGALVLGAFSAAVWQMIPGAPLLRELERLPVPAGSSLIALSSAGDAVVPPRYARLAEVAGQANRPLARLGHLELLWSQRCFQLVRAALA